MKNVTKMAIAAAALLVAAGTVSAQSMKAEIPFNFQAGGKTMTAGAYHLTRAFGSPPMITLWDTYTHESAIVVGTARIGDSYATAAKLVFRCTGSDCALQQVWTGSPGDNFELSVPHSREKELASIRIVSVRLQ